MAISEIYVDPSIAADSGTGTIGDPFCDLEYAIEQTTFYTTNGTRVNVKAGTDEVLAAVINTAMADTGTTVAWVPAIAAQMIVQGYTAAAGDGGIGGISGGGSIGIMTTDQFVSFIDMHLHNCGIFNLFVQFVRHFLSPVSLNKLADDYIYRVATKSHPIKLRK